MEYMMTTFYILRSLDPLAPEVGRYRSDAEAKAEANRLSSSELSWTDWGTGSWRINGYSGRQLRYVIDYYDS